MNKFEQLVDDLKTNKITHNQLQMALRASIREDEHLPAEIKDILCGAGEANAGLIYRMFRPIREVVGACELAYLRGKAEGPHEQGAL